MARNKKWTIPFKSLNGTNCRIDIFKEGYSGSAVTEISPNNANTPGYAAANPIDWQENDDDSLLNVLRYKTGYIRLIEKTSGSLIDLFPQTNLDHYVEFYYGATLMFNGYIQAQSFDNEWIAAPREINLPIISPLGVAVGVRMQTVTPGNVTIGSLLKTAISQLNAAYSYVLFPESSPHFAGVIKSVIPIPLNGDFDYLESGANDVYNPCYISDFIAGICNAYGWMVHDDPDHLSFSKFDHSGWYVKAWVADLNLSNIPTSEVVSGNSGLNFGSYFSISSDDGNVKTILPLKEVEIDFGEEPFEAASYDFTRLSYQGRDNISNVLVAIWMKPYGPEVEGTNDTNTAISLTTLQSRGVNVCAIGRPASLTKMFLINQTAQSNNEYLFTCRLYDVPKRDDNGCYTFTINGKTGEDLLMDLDQSAIVRCSIKAGSKYLLYDPEYIGNNRWVDSEQRNLIWINSQQNLIPIDVKSIPACEYIEFKFYSYTLPTEVKFIGITEIGIIAAKNGANEFDESQTTTKKLKTDTGTEDQANVNMLFNCQRNFLNQIDNTTLSLFTQYPYMFASQTKLTVTCKQLAAYSYPYFIRWLFWIQNWQWRIISISFTPWNDDYTIILHRSSAI